MKRKDVKSIKLIAMLTRFTIAINISSNQILQIDDFRNGKSHAPHCWSAVVVQQYNYIVALPLPDHIQCNYIAALPLPTRKQPTMVGVSFSISEVVYFRILQKILLISTILLSACIEINRTGIGVIGSLD
jgi:hypothetical protein